VEYVFLYGIPTTVKFSARTVLKSSMKTNLGSQHQKISDATFFVPMISREMSFY